MPYISDKLLSSVIFILMLFTMNVLIRRNEVLRKAFEQSLGNSLRTWYLSTKSYDRTLFEKSLGNTKPVCIEWKAQFLR